MADKHFCQRSTQRGTVALCRFGGGGSTNRGSATSGADQSIEAIARPGEVLLESSDLQEDGLPLGIAREGSLQSEFPAIDLGQPLTFESALTSEIEECEGVGGERLYPVALGAG